ncbi:MAG: DMT family transporter [Candidatus Marinimicrobia bacterium]|nr:DMT family transporter [Candidatus Neomarinimicrobiota bacterium]MCF7829664.1 DMT family transporter [Candidatus Neomarinimicrobiota bacterium]MCF7879824.1 DMT family transporter [Candidatus Neomarinimicrobiota bacterium]
MYYLIIGIGIIAASFAAIFIKIADDAPALIIAAYRLALATLIMTPYAASRLKKQAGRFTRSSLKWNILSGVFLALHFATWIASLKFTSVARSVILVSTNPLFVSVLGWVFLKEKVKPLVVIGIIVSFAGIVIMSLGELTGVQASFTGDALALSGAFFAAIYLLTGRNVRQTISATTYSYIAYGIAAIVLVGMSLTAGLPWTGYSLTTWSMFLLLAIVPQIIGHTSFNYALRYVPAVIVALAILGEPIMSSTLAWFILGEQVHVNTFYGGVLVLIGVFLAVYRQEQN